MRCTLGMTPGAGGAEVWTLLRGRGPFPSFRPHPGWVGQMEAAPAVVPGFPDARAEG